MSRSKIDNVMTVCSNTWWYNYLWFQNENEWCLECSHVGAREGGGVALFDSAEVQGGVGEVPQGAQGEGGRGYNMGVGEAGIR